MEMTVFLCEDTIEGILTGVYDGWASRKGHGNLRLQLAGESNLELFCQYQTVRPDMVKAEKVRCAIRQKISAEAWEMVYTAAMSLDPGKADAIYRFLTGGFHYGAQVTRMLAEPAVQKLFFLSRQVINESHHYQEFLRFELTENHILAARIRPKNNITAMIAPHFADRISGEDFLILDVGRSLAAIHPANRLWYLTRLSKEQTDRLSSGQPDIYRDLWKTFHDSIAIPDRINPKLQQSLMPFRFREFMPE